MTEDDKSDLHTGILIAAETKVWNKTNSYIKWILGIYILEGLVEIYNPCEIL